MTAMKGKLQEAMRSQARTRSARKKMALASQARASMTMNLLTKKQKSGNVSSRFISDWPEQIQVLVDQDAVPNTVVDNNCGSYTVVLKNGGKVQINKRKHFYILTKKSGIEGKRMVSWIKMGGIETAWKEAVKIAKP